jgi:hypothetical protein
MCPKDPNEGPAIISSSAAVSLVLESRVEVERRNARARGVVCGGHGGRFQLGPNSTRDGLGLIRQIDLALGKSDATDSTRVVEEMMRGSFSVAPLAKVIAWLFLGSSGSRQNIIAHDGHGFANGVAIKVL